jgi:hypothetical protein
MRFWDQILHLQSSAKSFIFSAVSFVVAMLTAVALFWFIPVTGVQRDAVIITPENLQNDLFVLEVTPRSILIDELEKSAEEKTKYRHALHTKENSVLFSLATYGKDSRADLAQENREVLEGLFNELGTFYGQKVFSERFAGTVFRSVGSAYEVVRWNLVLSISLVAGIFGGLLRSLLHRAMRSKGRSKSTDETLAKDNGVAMEKIDRDSIVNSRYVAHKDNYMQTSLSREAKGERAQKNGDRLIPLARLLESKKPLGDFDDQNKRGFEDENDLLLRENEGWTHDHWEEMEDVMDEALGQDEQQEEIEKVAIRHDIHLEPSLPKLDGKDEDVLTSGAEPHKFNKEIAIVDQPEKGDNPRVSDLLSKLSHKKSFTATQEKTSINTASTGAAPGNLPVVDASLLEAFNGRQEKNISPMLRKADIETVQRDQKISQEQFRDKKDQLQSNQLKTEDVKIVDFESAQSQQLVESEDVSDLDQDDVVSVSEMHVSGVPEPTDEELKERLNKLLRGEL